MLDVIQYGFDLFGQCAEFFVQPLFGGIQIWHLYAVIFVLSLGVMFVVSWYRRG